MGTPVARRREEKNIPGDHFKEEYLHTLKGRIFKPLHTERASALKDEKDG